ncbi:MAG: sulfatase-like hydrolase/transferase [Holophagales bacterium]|nr:sulfatase-like hydrolase/transferase [Holophagales bacterium]
MSRSTSIRARRIAGNGALAVVAAAALTAVLGGCRPAVRPPVNVVLVSIDTLRADRLGCYGGTTVETPAIDSLSNAGVRFQNAFTPVPLTLPAHWTILTGVEPWHHGVVDNGMTLPKPPAATLAERFADAGYDTAAFVSAFVLHRTFGLDRGFARYDDGPAADAVLDELMHASAPADERVDRALAWLRRERKRPFFVWLHLFDPHAPYVPPPGFRARYSGRPYDGEVAFVDTQVARLLAALERSGIADRTLVVLLSDHAESLGEHGEETHGLLLYDATLRVPLLFRLPGTLGAGEVRPEAVTLADVAPTILALTGLPATPGVDGRDLFGPAASPLRQLGAVSQAPVRRFGWASLTAVREAGWKFIAAPRSELYRIADDPAELVDRRASDPDRAVGLARAARGIEATLNARLAARGTVEPGSEALARLSALGYVSGPASTASAPPDPKDAIRSMGELDRAYQLFAEGRLDEAQASLNALLARSDFPPSTVLEGLGRLARLRGDAAEAEKIFLQMIAQDPEALGPLAQLVRLARERGDRGAEVERARRLVALAPADGGAARLLAEALLGAGDSAGAEEEYRRGLKVAPRSGWLRLGLARLLVATRRGDEADRELEKITSDEDLPGDVIAEARTLRSRPAR